MDPDRRRRVSFGPCEEKRPRRPKFLPPLNWVKERGEATREQPQPRYPAAKFIVTALVVGIVGGWALAHAVRDTPGLREAQYMYLRQCQSWLVLSESG